MFCVPAFVPVLQVGEGADEPVLHMGTPKVGSKFNNSCSLETIIRLANPKRPELHNLLQEQAYKAGRELQRVSLSGRDLLEFILTKSPQAQSLLSQWQQQRPLCGLLSSKYLAR